MEVAEKPKKSRLRLFVENMLVYGLGGVIGKLVPLVMLPVVTRLMPGTTYFGLSDLSNTLVSFGQAFAIMGMYDAMFRMFFEQDELNYKRRVCSTAFFFVTSCSLIVASVIFIFRDSISGVLFGSVEFSSLATVSALSVLVGGNNSIIQAPTRMQNKKITFIAMNLVTSILSYLITIPMILAGMYLMALPVGGLLASLTALIVFAVLNRNWFSFGAFDGKLLREMLAIGVPLMPTFLFYWIFNSADRIMIVNLIGADASGIYAVAAKLGHVSQLIYTGFSQGWQYFAFSTMKDSDQVDLNSRVYEYLGVVSFFATGALLVFLKPLYNVLFPERYASGVYSVPYLFLAPLLLMLYQVAANQLLVVKKTWPALIVLFFGGAANIVANMVLISRIGIEGASVATLIGYALTNAGVLALLTHMKLLRIRTRFYAVVLAGCAYFILWRFVTYGSIVLTLLPFVVFLCIVGILYKQELKALIVRLGMKRRVD